MRIAGRFHYLGRHGSPESREKFHRIVAEWIAAGRPRPWHREGEGLTVAELVARFRAHAAGYYRTAEGKPTGELAAIAAALEDVVRLYGSAKAKEFGPLALRTIRDVWIRKGLVRTTVNSYAARVKRMFRWAASLQLITGDQAQALSCLARLSAGRSEAAEPIRRGAVRDSDIEAVLPFVAEPVRAMIRLQRLTGMRPGELCALRASRIDRSAAVWTCSPRHHKTVHLGKSRAFLFGPRAQAILAPLIAAAERRAHLRLTGDELEPDRLFRYREDSYRRAIARACKLAGVPHWTPNQLRKAAATEFRRRFGIEATSILLGHASLKTSEIYAEADEEIARRVMEEIG